MKIWPSFFSAWWRDLTFFQKWLLVFLAAITLGFDPHLAAPFDLIKTIVLWNGAAGFAVYWLGAPLKSARPLPFRYHSLILLFFCMIAGFLPSLFKSRDFYPSIFGAYPFFFGGLLSWISFGLVFFLVFQAADRNFARRLPVFAAGIAACACAYGVIQYFGLDPMPWQTSPYEVFATLGGALFFAGYVAMIFPLVLAACCLAQRKAAALMILLLIVMSALLLTTLARSAWLGAIGGLGFFLVFIGRENIRRHLKKLTILGGLFGVLLLWVLFIGPAVKREPSQIQNRAKVLLSSQEGSAKARLEMWKVGLMMFLDHPLLGIGLDNVEQYFWNYRSVEHLRLTSLQATTVPMHNDFLHILTTTGIVGFAFCLAFLAGGVRLFWRLNKNLAGEDRMFAGAFGGGLAALAIFGQFNFSVAATSLWAVFFLAGLACFDSCGKEFTAPAKVRRLAAVFAGLFLLFLLYKSAVIYAADRAFANGNLYANKKNFPKSYANLKLAVELNPHLRQYYYSYGMVLTARANASKGGQEKDNFLKMASLVFAKNCLMQPWYALAWHNLAASQLNRAADKGGPLLEMAKESLRRTARLFPVFPQIYNQYGEILERQGKNKGARRLWEFALSLESRFLPARRHMERFRPPTYVYFFNQDLRIAGAPLGAQVPNCRLKLVNDREEPAQVSLEIVAQPQTLYSDLAGMRDLAELGLVRLAQQSIFMPPNSIVPVELEIRIPRWPWWRGKTFAAIVHAKDELVRYPFGTYGRIIVETAQ